MYSSNVAHHHHQSIWNHQHHHHMEKAQQIITITIAHQDHHHGGTDLHGDHGGVHQAIAPPHRIAHHPIDHPTHLLIDHHPIHHPTHHHHHHRLVKNQDMVGLKYGKKKYWIK